MLKATIISTHKARIDPKENSLISSQAAGSKANIIIPLIRLKYCFIDQSPTARAPLLPNALIRKDIVNIKNTVISRVPTSQIKVIIRPNINGRLRKSRTKT